MNVQTREGSGSPSTIGADRAAKLADHIRDDIGHPHPLHFANSWCRFKIADLSQLSSAQARELIQESKSFVAWGRATKKKDDEREERRLAAYEKRRAKEEAIRAKLGPKPEEQIEPPDPAPLPEPIKLEPVPSFQEMRRELEAEDRREVAQAKERKTPKGPAFNPVHVRSIIKVSSNPDLRPYREKYPPVSPEEARRIADDIKTRYPFTVPAHRRPNR